MRLKNFIFLFCIFSVLLVGNAAQTYALNINQVRYGSYPDKARIVIELDQAVDFRSFILTDPSRLVVDLPDFQWKAGTDLKNDQLGILGVRYGDLEKKISRIVFDLKAASSIQSAFLLPKTPDKPNRLVIDINFAGMESFKVASKDVFGTLLPERSQKPVSHLNSRTASFRAKHKPDVKIEKPLVILDPGHGGQDPGAIGANGVYEKTIALALAKELKKQLLASGRYHVKLTRETDKFIKLSNRVKFARNHGGDLFISIHADSLSRPNVRGASVYTLSEKASDAQTAKLAARENRADLIAGIDLETEDKDVANILMDLAMRDTMNQSKFFANTLVSSLKGSDVKLLDRPHRYAGFAVLKAPDIPSVLVESGFMSNKREANLLTKPEHRKKIALSLKKGIDAYFNTVAEGERG